MQRMENEWRDKKRSFFYGPLLWVVTSKCLSYSWFYFCSFSFSKCLHNINYLLYPLNIYTRAESSISTDNTLFIVTLQSRAKDWRNSNESRLVRFLSIYRNVRATCHAINPLLAKVPISLAACAERRRVVVQKKKNGWMVVGTNEWQVVWFSFAYRCANYFCRSLPPALYLWIFQQISCNIVVVDW